MKNALKIVILGNGVAGVSTAAALRKRVPDPETLQITILSREPHDYYSRIRLPEVFRSSSTAEDLRVYESEWYDRRAIRVIKNLETDRIDPVRKEVVGTDGTHISYDRLIVATGAEAVRPSIEGVNLEGVFTVREFGDAERLRAHVAERGGEIVVMGGGLLGLEAARHLTADGASGVTVVEIADRLLPRQLDEAGAALLERALRETGLRFVLGAQVERFTGTASVEGVELRDGRVLPAKTVVICMGIRPRASIALEAGLAVGRGIRVDARMRTSDPWIYAAGDVVEFEGTVFGILPAAMDQARVAAAAVLGDETASYSPAPPRTTLKVAGVSLTSIGEVTGRLEDCDILTVSDHDSCRYEKYVIRNNCLAGAILLGSTENLSSVMNAIGKRIEPSAFESSLKRTVGSTVNLSATAAQPAGR